VISALMLSRLSSSTDEEKKKQERLTPKTLKNLLGGEAAEILSRFPLVCRVKDSNLYLGRPPTIRSFP